MGISTCGRVIRRGSHSSQTCPSLRFRRGSKRRSPPHLVRGDDTLRDYGAVPDKAHADPWVPAERPVVGLQAMAVLVRGAASPAIQEFCFMVLAHPNQRHIAFYLPQFHPIVENDEWWGPGFTEWTNVAQSRPRFRGHQQPHVPADLGYYDLRLPETRSAQANLARTHGIDAFCYYHYWFAGKRLLERPFKEVLDSGEPSFPFLLCWANENWTRAWDGQERQILMHQDYAVGEQDHGRYLARAFSDPRYLRIDGKPLFLVYRANRLPNTLRSTDVWRDEAQKAGVGEILILRVESFPDERVSPIGTGFDGAVQFSPDQVVIQRMSQLRRVRLEQKVRRIQTRRHTLVLDYEEVMEEILRIKDPDYLRFPCVTPGWDNSARRKDWSLVLRDSSPELYAKWVRRASDRAPTTDGGESLVFVNAWNEWAEGAHLEPDRRWGRQYLEAHLQARLSRPPGVPA